MILIKKFLIGSLVLFTLFPAVMIYGQVKPNDHSIWFNRPADSWNEALPVGNGRLGAMIFGGIQKERIQLNEQTIWTGKDVDFVNPGAKEALPVIRKLLFEGKYEEAQKMAKEKMMGNRTVGSDYQTMGDLNFSFQLPANISDYRRELDIDLAISRVHFRAGNTVFDREVFSSFPDQAIVIKFTSSKTGALTFTVAISRPGKKATINQTPNEITMTEKVGDGIGVSFFSRLKIINHGGGVTISNGAIQVSGADDVTMILTAATDYWGGDPTLISKNQQQAIENKEYELVKASHVADYQQYFKRVSLNLGKSAGNFFPTDARIVATQNGYEDPELIELYYQFGRYLLISSSRPGGLPANLQGIWADGLNPPWSADYHININIQMNYWPAEITNLSEMHMPFLSFLKALQPDAHKTAKDMYGLPGAVAHFTTDPWHFTEPYGEPQWAMWPMGLAWCARHQWEHYLFSGNEAFLDTLGYPIMKEAALFCVNWLVKNPATGLLVSGPSISPENTFRTKDGKIATMVMGPTMDHMIIRDLLTNTIAAARVLQTDQKFIQAMEKILQNLSPVKTGNDGRILEWTEAFDEPEPGHRHISHLYGLYPGNQISKQKTPDLLTAARKTIDYRLAHGGGHTGWSRAWIINDFARLHDGEAAYQNLLASCENRPCLTCLITIHPFR